VALCLAGDLAGELFDLMDQLEQVGPPMHVGDNPRADLQRQIDAVRERMRESNVELVLRAVDALEWAKYNARIPVRRVADPAKGVEEETDEQWQARLAPAEQELVALTVVDPVLDQAGAAKLNASIHWAAWVELVRECQIINRVKLDVPNSVAASSETPSSEPN
jgi:hypothetical protein